MAQGREQGAPHEHVSSSHSPLVRLVSGGGGGDRLSRKLAVDDLDLDLDLEVWLRERDRGI